MIKEEQWQDTSVYTLTNDKLTISLCPSLNNNVYRIWDHTLQREVLRVPDSPQQLAEQPVQFGTPILMPPNRIRKGRFQYEGVSYQFNTNPAQNNNHIHGLLRNLPWTVTNVYEGEGIASITSTFDTSDYPDIVQQYPHSLKLDITYELIGSTLTHKLAVTNNSSTKAPFGYGLHTWFLLDNEPQNWNLELPVASIWELDAELMPTGTLLPLDDYSELQNGMNLQGQNMDTVFQIGENPRLAVLKKDNCELRYTTSEEFKHWVIYTKGQADNFICLEPYTWVTNAPNVGLSEDITGLIGIEPGQTLELEVTLELIYT
ncbi:Aldose 1-epimerase [compost metagenome]